MELLNRTTGRLLEPLFAFLAAHTPDPFVISDATAPLNLLAHVPVLVLAFLLFSPHDSWLVRAALVPLAVAATFYLGFKFRFTHPAWGEKDKGMSMTAVYWSMKAVELGLRRERPLWVGWEFDEGQARATRQAKANAADTWRERAYLAVCYCYVSAPFVPLLRAPWPRPHCTGADRPTRLRSPQSRTARSAGRPVHRARGSASLRRRPPAGVRPRRTSSRPPSFTCSGTPSSACSPCTRRSRPWRPPGRHRSTSRCCRRSLCG